MYTVYLFLSLSLFKLHLKASFYTISVRVKTIWRRRYRRQRRHRRQILSRPESSGHGVVGVATQIDPACMSRADIIKTFLFVFFS
jgi:hypothetical protein